MEKKFMTLKNQLFKCDICDNIAQIVHSGAGTLVCCGEDMQQLDEKRAETGNPHYAQIKRDGQNVSIKFDHEMIPEHYIEMIEVISNDEKYLKRKYLNPNEPAEMNFKCDCKDGFKVRIYCNIHGVLVTEEK